MLGEMEKRIDDEGKEPEDEPEYLPLDGKLQEKTQIGQKKEQERKDRLYAEALPLFISSSLKNLL